MATCPHCHATLVSPAVFCGVCGARLGSGTDKLAPDDPGATTRLDGPAAETQPMQLPAAAAPARPPVAAPRRADSLLRLVRPRWPRPVAVALGAGLLLGCVWLVWSASSPAPDALRRPVAIAPVEERVESESPTAITPPPRRVGRNSARTALDIIGRPAATGDPAAAAPPQAAPASPEAAPPPPGTPAPAPVDPAAPAAAAPPSPAGAAAPDAAAPEGVSKDDLEAAARYMKGEEAVPASAEDLAERDRAEGYAGSIRMVVKTHAAQVGACYERAFKFDAPSHAARVEIGFTVDAKGVPGKVRTVSNTSGSDALANCLAQRVGGWRFPRPPGGDFEAVYPFTFSGAR